MSSPLFSARRLGTAGALNHGYFGESPLACSAHSLRLSSSRSCHEFTTSNVASTVGQKRLRAITGRLEQLPEICIREYVKLTISVGIYVRFPQVSSGVFSR